MSLNLFLLCLNSTLLKLLFLIINITPFPDFPCHPVEYADFNLMPNLLGKKKKKGNKKIRNNFGISISYFRISEIDCITHIIEYKTVGWSFLFVVLTPDSSISFVISCFMIWRSSCIFSSPFFPSFSFVLVKVLGLFV